MRCRTRQLRFLATSATSVVALSAGACGSDTGGPGTAPARQAAGEAEAANAPAKPRAAARPCEPARSHTVRRAPSGRVYSKGDVYYGCLYRVGRAYPLVRAREVEYGLTIEHVRFAPPYVGFGYLLDEVELGSVGYVRVLDLRTGRRSTAPAAERGFYSDVHDLVMSRRGAMAWIAQGYYGIEGERVPRGCRPRNSYICDFPKEVRKRHGRRVAEVDSGFGVARRSLQLHDAAISWLHLGARRSARLP